MQQFSFYGSEKPFYAKLLINFTFSKVNKYTYFMYIKLLFNHLEIWMRGSKYCMQDTFARARR